VQAYILELGHHYMRVHYNPTGGQPGPVLEPTFVITGATVASPCVITIPGHNFALHDALYITNLPQFPALQGGTFLVAGVAGANLTLNTLDGTPMSTIGMPAYASFGTAARLYTLTTPYAAADLQALKFTQTSKTMTIVHPSYAPRTLTRSQHYSWTLSSISFAAQVFPPTTLAANQVGTTATIGWYYAYLVTSQADDPAEESIASAIVHVPNVTALNQTTGVMNAISWVVPATGSRPSRYRIYKSNAVYGSAVPTGAVFGFIGTTTGLTFTDLNVGPDFAVTPPLHRNPFANGAIVAATVTASGTGYLQPALTITDATGSGAVIQLAQVSGAIGAGAVIDGGHDYTAPTATVVDLAGVGTGGTVTLTIGPTTGNNPGAVEYDQQRLCFAATANAPENIWGTQPANPTNMDVSSPVVDSDALTVRLFSKQDNAIRHLLAMPTGLVALTSAGAWLINGGGGTQSPQPLTPSNQSAQPQASNGVSDLVPLTIDTDILFGQARGSYIRVFQYNIYSNSYAGTDISILSNHLFNGRTIVDWCWAEEPHKLAWAIRDDGMLLSLTYLKQQEVLAWSHHDTKGFFRSTASIPEGNEDAVYFVVERFIGGQWLYLIERMHSRLLGGDPTRDIPGDVRLAWCVDAGLSYPLTYPAATLTATGLTEIATVKGSPLYAGAGTFAASAPITVHVGDALEINGGLGVVTVGVTSGTSFQATIGTAQPMWNLLPATAGTWSCTTPVTVISGLNHLEGEPVSIVADGGVVLGKTVVNATVILPVAATRIYVGPGYTCQLQSLRIEAGQTTMQGRRKKITQVVARVVDTRGLKAGHDFKTMWEFKGPSAYQAPQQLITGDQIITLDPRWEQEGQVCFQQDYPLPAQIIAIIPSVEPGDT
jgi:hypothetical protein